MIRKLLQIVLIVIGEMAVPIIAEAQIDVDYAVFRFDSTQVYWEIYYAVPRSRITYVNATTGGFSCDVLFRMMLVKNGVPWKELAWKVQDVLPDTVQTWRQQKLIDRVQVLAPPGTYSVTLSAKDLHNPVTIDSTSFSVIVSGFPTAELGMSDIELASSIEKNFHDEKSQFYKNTLFVVPNPSRVFGGPISVLHFYVETYNLESDIPGKNYKIRYFISDGNDKPMEEIEPVSLSRQKEGDSRVEIGSVPVTSLPMGTYFFHFAITDSTDKELVAKNTKFYAYNVDQVRQKTFDSMNQIDLVLQSEFGSMTESELDQDFSYAVYLSTPEERELYNPIKGVESKRRFLYSFWEKKNMDPSRPLSEFHKEYIKRIQYADENYSTFQKKGWRLDRGRVYILYGAPSDIERNPNTEGCRPFEIWHYHEIQGGVVFVFADLSGFRDYTLIHSTARGEVQYPEYMQRIERGY